jgi:hypothetical protein
MASIVRPILSEQTVKSTITELQEAHDYLADCGAQTMQTIAGFAESRSWGQAVKREKVQLSDVNRPKLCRDAPSEHSVTEVYNQCATMERLIDTLRWLDLSGGDWAGSTVIVCHPTNTSGSGENTELDFDLAVRSPSGEIGCFEVSDVASKADGNFKEGTDLAKFKVVEKLDRGKFRLTGVNPTALPGRCFLVVSEEFSNRMRRPRHPWLIIADPTFHYVEVKEQGSTRIFEIVAH